MSQTYTADCYGAAHGGQADLLLMEQNFAALKSTFSGAGAPANAIAGLLWFDTDANILKLRNEANDAWLSIWDLANNKPVITNLSGEITGAMIAAAIKDPAAGTDGLRTIGTGALQACAGNDSRLSNDRTPADNAVTMEKMQHGSIMLPYYMAPDATAHSCATTPATTWTDTGMDRFLAYIPADATTITAAIRAKVSAGDAFLRFLVSGTGASSSKLDTSYDWYTGGTLDVSGKSGWDEISWQFYLESVGQLIQVQGFSFIWE